MADYRSTGKELRKSPKGLIAGIIGVCLLAGAGYGVYRVGKGLDPLTAEISQSSSEPELSVPEMSTPDEPENKIIFQYEAVFASSVHSGPLMLVNRQFGTTELTEGLTPIYQKKTGKYGLRDVSLRLRDEVIPALDAMSAGISSALGYSPFLINSAYRTMAEQRAIYSAALKPLGHDSDATPAMAGFSDYQTGYSVGITLSHNGFYELSSEKGKAERDWLEAHAAEYGFVLRYPQGKSPLTEFQYDASHYRYVGLPHALYMAKNSLTLEEYLTLLRNYPYDGDHLSMPNAAGKRCEVFYFPLGPEGDTGTLEIPVPADYPYSISGNNTDGFIVTVETDDPFSE